MGDSRSVGSVRGKWFLLGLIVPVVVIGGLAVGVWRVPQARLWVSELLAETEGDEHDHEHESAKKDAHSPGEAETDEHDHEGHEEGAAEPAHKSDHLHDEAAAIKLSAQARGNIGLRLAQVEASTFERTISVPGIVVERPGRSTLDVTAPMAGVVTRVYPIQGEAVQVGQLLFEIRLTHEELLQVQTDFLKAAEELDVIGEEVARIEKVAAQGAIAGKTLLERQYEKRKQEAMLRAQRQALLLHGLSEQQVAGILANRTLLQGLTVVAPTPQETSPAQAAARPLQVQELKVAQGKYVSVGDLLCTLVDHSELYVEGKAFEQDIEALSEAAAQGRKVSAVVGAKAASDAEALNSLRILYLDTRVDAASRAFPFYVVLPNRLIREDKSVPGHRFLYWRFKPGQRMQLKIPVEQWKDRIVLPVEAVVQEGAEFFVFEANEDHFDRRSVRVEYRDQERVVIANDGSLCPGKMVAASAAHQMQLALKNKAGGGIDPHAGHNH